MSITRLALVGPKHSGKSTLAGYLVGGHGWRRLGHADPIKTGTAHMLSSWLQFHFPAVLKRRRELGQGDISGRITEEEIAQHKGAFVPLLQAFGQWARDYLPADDLWVEHLAGRIIATAHTYPAARLVVDDCRLPSEAAALRDLGFVILRLGRPEEERLHSVRADLLRGGVPPTEVERRMAAMLAHSTETDLDDIVPEAVVVCRDKLELGALAERIATAAMPW